MGLQPDARGRACDHERILRRRAGGSRRHRDAIDSGQLACRLAVQLLPVSAVVLAGHRVRVAIAGHDASSFTRYGPAEETFTLRLGSDSHLDLPVRYGLQARAGRPLS
jgi:predicted acyl esterase